MCSNRGRAKPPQSRSAQRNGTQLARAARRQRFFLGGGPNRISPAPPPNLHSLPTAPRQPGRQRQKKSFPRNRPKFGVAYTTYAGLLQKKEKRIRHPSAGANFFSFSSGSENRSKGSPQTNPESSPTRPGSWRKSPLGHHGRSETLFHRWPGMGPLILMSAPFPQRDRPKEK